MNWTASPRGAWGCPAWDSADGWLRLVDYSQRPGLARRPFHLINFREKDSDSEFKSYWFYTAEEAKRFAEGL